MKSCLPSTCIVALALGATMVHAADIGIAFIYQGTLEDGSGLVTDTCDFRIGLWDADMAGNQVGTSPQTSSMVDVLGGVFTVSLDYGPGAIDGTARWLEIEVQCTGDAGFTLLSPRVELTAAPHALALRNFRAEPAGINSQAYSGPNIIGGYSGNSVAPGVVGATLLGGAFDHLFFSSLENVVEGSLATVSGGAENVAGSTGATVGGGMTNSATGGLSVVAGGKDNTASQAAASVGGGESNTASGVYSTVGGGLSNMALNDGGTVGGGFSNTASANSSTVSGGISNQANGPLSTVGGGNANLANEHASTVPGGQWNLAGGIYSFAAGRRAKVRDDDSTSPYYSGDTDGDEGTLVWADSTDADLVSTGPNQFLIRAGGGVGIGTNNPTDPLTVAGVIRSTAGGFELPDGTIIDAASDLGLGDITGVTAGTGLTGGGTSGSVTLNVAYAGNGAANSSARSDHYHSSLAASDGSPLNAIVVDAVGNVGIGTASLGEKLTVVGVVHSTSGGIKFPDNTTQTTACPVILSASVAVNPPSISAGSNTTMNVTVTGAAVGDAVVANPGGSLSASYAIQFVRVSAANTVTIGLFNPGSVTVDPASTTWEFRIIK